MNKKQNLLAIALSASFVLAGANVAEANDQVNAPVQDVDQAVDSVSDQKPAGQDDKDANLPQEGNEQESQAQADPQQGQASADEKEKKKSGLDALINKEGIKNLADKKEGSETAQTKPLGIERSANNEGLQKSEEKTPEAQGQAREAGAPAQNEDSNKEAPKKDEVEEAQPKAPKPLTDEEVAKLEAAAKRVRPRAESVKVDPTTGWITVKTKVKVKKGDKEVEEDREETINPYTPAGDEALIQDYDDSDRYKQTDLQPGDTNQSLVKTDEKVEKDGFKFEIKNPSETSPSKTEYGYQITIDKKTGQRTYTKIDVTDSGLIPVNPGNKPMMGQGDKITPESPDVTYKPNEDTAIDKSGRQMNLNYGAEEETLKHINNKDNDSTSLGMKDNYTQDNPSKKFFGGNFAITYKVNPWPNENDKLELLKLNGQYNDKVFVQGQEIDTGIKVDNIDESAKERLVGQVYHPVTGKIVP